MTNAIAEQDDAELVPGSRGMAWDWGFYQGNFSWFVHVAGGPEVIATVHGDGAEAADRARLIASAPKLLEALGLLVGNLDADHALDDLDGYTREALEKARLALSSALGA